MCEEIKFLIKKIIADKDGFGEAEVSIWFVFIEYRQEQIIEVIRSLSWSDRITIARKLYKLEDRALFYGKALELKRIQSATKCRWLSFFGGYHWVAYAAIFGTFIFICTILEVLNLSAEKACILVVLVSMVIIKKSIDSVFRQNELLVHSLHLDDLQFGHSYDRERLVEIGWLVPCEDNEKSALDKEILRVKKKANNIFSFLRRG